MLPNSRKQFLSKCSSHHSCQLPSPFRFLSSLQSNNDNDSDAIKPKPSTKTKKARALARIINHKEWSSELESSLSSLSPSLSKTTVSQTLRLIKAPLKALKFFDWVINMGFPHDDQSYFFMLEVLGRDRNLNIARNFLFAIEKRSNGSVKLEDRYFNSLIRSYGDAGLFQESVKLFETMKTFGVSPSVVSFNSLLMILLKRGRTNMARSVFDEMLKTFGVTPDVYTFNILIKGFCKNSMVKEGFWCFREMERFECEPDVVTYNTIVDGLCQAGKVKIAHNVVKGMYKKSLALHPNVVTYTTLIRGYCMKQEIEEATLVLQEMINRGLKPNDITFNTLIKGLCEAKEFDKVKEIWEGARGFIPDTCTLNILINTHCDADNLDEALKVFKNMSNLQVRPDSATYSVLIRSLCKRRDFDKAEELFDELSEKGIVLDNMGSKPLVAAYNPIFEYLCTNGKTSKAENFFRQLMKSGVQDPSSYKTLITGHLTEGTFQAAFELLVLMLRRDFVPDSETYHSLINGLLRKKEPLIAYNTLVKMIRSSYLPEPFIFHSTLSELISSSHASEAFDLIVLMLEKQIRQNITLSTQTVRLLLGSGFYDKAFQIIGLLYENGYLVKTDELISFLCQRRKFINAHKLLLFCLENDQTIDISMYDVVISGLCKIKKLSEAFGLFYQLVERGYHRNLSSLEALKNALEVGGEEDRVIFVTKRMAPQGNSTDSVAKLNKSAALL